MHGDREASGSLVMWGAAGLRGRNMSVRSSAARPRLLRFRGEDFDIVKLTFLFEAAVIKRRAGSD